MIHLYIINKHKHMFKLTLHVHVPLKSIHQTYKYSVYSGLMNSVHFWSCSTVLGKELYNNHGTAKQFYK